MSETEEGIQRVQSSFNASDSSSSIPKLQSHIPFNHLDIRQLNTVQNHAQIRDFSLNFHTENNSKRVGIPPAHPQISLHSPSSQISPFFSTDSLPPLSPSHYRDPTSTRIPDNLPPRKTHRRSNSDIPFSFSTILQSSPPLIPLRGSKSVQLVKGESEGEVVDDMFSTYTNLNNLGRLNSFRPEHCEDLDSRASGTKANGNGNDNSDNEATSSMLKSGICLISDKKEGIKRSAGGDIAPTTRHCRSVSMDSFIGKMNFVDESLKLPPSPQGQFGKLLPSEAIDANSDTFSLEFGNGMFTGAELKKIMANENLAEIALTDPKRVKRILANRQSAARSKERKTRYISELENKVQNLQTEATTLSTQFTLLQRDSANLTNQNNELKFRLQSMEQQAQLRDALNEALTAEVQRLKMMTMELSGDATKFSQLSINPQMFQLHHQYEEQPSQQQNGSTTTTHE